MKIAIKMLPDYNIFADRDVGRQFLSRLENWDQRVLTAIYKIVLINETISEYFIYFLIYFA